MTAHAPLTTGDLFLALAVVIGLDALLLAAIALAKIRRERAERFEALVRDDLTERLFPLLEGAAGTVSLPPSGGARSRIAFETVLSLIAVLKGEARDRLVALLEDAGYIGYLVRRSRTKSTALRMRCMMRLGGTRSLRAVPRLTAVLLQDRSPEVRIVAAESLGAIGHPPSVSVLLEAARDPTRVQELRLANVLSSMGTTALPALQRVLSESDTRLVSLALDILIDIGTITDPAPVVKLLTHRSPEVRARAALLLGLAGIIEAIPALVFASRDSVWFVRLRIVKALAAIGLPDDEQGRSACFAALTHLLYDDSWHVRRNAAAALAAAGPAGREILSGVASEVALAALQFYELHRGRHMATVL